MFRGLRISSREIEGLMILGCPIILLMLAPAASQAQVSRDDENTPAFSSFKGLRIGMSADEARKKLGKPSDKSPEQDFYVFNDNEAAQVFYDTNGRVFAVSINLLSGAKDIPTPKDVFGTEAKPKPDGSVYKLVRYQKAGYWVLYTRTAGPKPLVTITIQKIE